MIDYSVIRDLVIPEGVVVKIENEVGQVLWVKVVDDSHPIILQVEKITSDTYAGETTYTGEQFILLDIYPRTNGTVKVTYGGVEQTITDTSGVAEPNAHQVFFGTFNGVSNGATTPASGELAIEGDCYGFAVGTFATTSKGGVSYYNGVRAIKNFGSVDVVADNAFYNCDGIINVVIPKSAKLIGNSAFYNCTNLKIVRIENGLNSINTSAFMGCNLLEYVYIPKSVSFISYNAFSNTIPSRLIIDSQNNFYKTDNDCLIDIANNTVVRCFQNFIIPSYVSAIGTDAGRAAGFTSVNIPTNVKVIGSNAFSNNPLNNINIAEGVEILGDKAFANNYEITTITIPSTVKSIGSGCFESCININSYHILSTTPPLISSDSLTVALNSGLFKIFVPKGCGEAYKSAPVWSDYASKIVEAS